MTTSTLNPANLPVEPDHPFEDFEKRHGTRAFGPSDTSDSGSDLIGGPGLAQQIEQNFDKGTTSDIEQSTAHNTAGPDIGDANLDSDTDSSGTGERATAARDAVVVDGADIGFDHIE